MKLSKLLTFCLLFMLSNFADAQNSRIVEVHDDESNLYMEYYDGELTVLKIDDKIIPKEGYKNHQTIIDKYQNKEKRPEAEVIIENAKLEKEAHLRKLEHDKTHGISRVHNDDLAKHFEAVLDKEDLLFNPVKYSLKLTNKVLIVNGNKMPDGLRNRLATIAYDIADINDKDDYSVKIKMKKECRSISVSVEE